MATFSKRRNIAAALWIYALACKLTFCKGVCLVGSSVRWGCEWQCGVREFGLRVWLALCVGGKTPQGNRAEEGSAGPRPNRRLRDAGSIGQGRAIAEWLVVAQKQTTSREILLWMTPSEAPKALQASECSELLDPTGASYWIFAQRQPGKFASQAQQGVLLG